MKRALTLAHSVLGQTWPNPAVGAVVVREGVIVGEGATAKGGRPHAETIALQDAGNKARGAALYISLEPCSHHGKTPPCTEAIIQAGISECIVACRDPNPKVNGQGIAQLQAAGIKVIESIEEKDAHELNRGFFSVIEKNRPFIAMKIAASRDGKIAAVPGVRTDITGPESRQYTHELRAQFDGILTGIGTVLADDPLLTVRIPGMEHRSPVRIVLDSHDRMSRNSKLRLSENEVPLWVYTREDDVIAELTKRGITRLLIEAGQGVNTSFLASGMVDRIYWYEALLAIGPAGLDAVKGGRNLAGWQVVEERLLGTDKLTIYEKGA